LILRVCRIGAAAYALEWQADASSELLEVGVLSGEIVRHVGRVTPGDLFVSLTEEPSLVVARLGVEIEQKILSS
jgi:hypothetical protein